MSYVSAEEQCAEGGIGPRGKKEREMRVSYGHVAGHGVTIATKARSRIVELEERSRRVAEG